MKIAPITRLLLSAVFFSSSPVTAQLFWDANGVGDGRPNGSGVWNTTNSNWWDGITNTTWINSASAIANIGGGAAVGSSTNITTITLEGTLQLAQLNFLGFTAAPASGQQYTINGSVAGTVIDFGANGLIQIDNNASGGSQFIVLGANIVLKGSDLTVQKYGTATTTSYLTFGGNSSLLTGTLTLAENIYANVSSPVRFPNVTHYVIKTGGTATLSNIGGTDYTTPFTIAGTPAYGAIRMLASNLTISGGITLSANAGIHTYDSPSLLTNSSVTGIVINSPITDNGNGYSFHRYAMTTGNGTFAFAAANTYGGDTVLGYASATYSGGITILDFAAATSPQTDILYHGLDNPGGLQLIGGNYTGVLRVQGKDHTDNSQRLGDIKSSRYHSSIEVISGYRGSMDLSVGSFIRESNTASLHLVAPATGSITTTSQPDGPIGAWVTFADVSGQRSWAQVINGVVTGGFTGDTLHTTDTAIGNSPGTHIQLSSSSTGDVIFADTTTDIATLSMTDANGPRFLNFEFKTLRLGTAGGLQMTEGAQSLIVGTPDDFSKLTAGGGAGLTGQLALTNFSKDHSMEIYSNIANNGAGAVTLLVNGSGRVVLKGANTYTGGTVIASGVLEIQHAGALSTSGDIIIPNGGTLALSGDIVFDRAINLVNGFGDGGVLGAIRNESGNNTIRRTITMQGPTLITANAGTTLTLAPASGNAVSNAFHLHFGGDGDFEVLGPLAQSTATLNKNGFGQLTLAATNTSTGAANINNGTLKLDFDRPTSPASNILNAATPINLNNDSTLQIYGKTNAESTQTLGLLTLGINANATISAVSNGSGSMTVNFGLITRNAGAILNIVQPDSGAIKTTWGTDNSVLVSSTGTPFALIGQDDWAATTAAVSSLRSIVSLSSINGYTLSTESTLSGNADMAAGITTVTLDANTTTTSLRFNQPQATTITNAAGTTPLLTTSGILVTPAVGANPTVINSGSIRPTTNTNELVIVQNNTDAPLTIRGKILNAVNGNNAAITTALTKTGPGALVLEFDNKYVSGDLTGAVRIQDGSLQIVRTSASIENTYLIYASSIFTLGSGATSGKLILGRDNVEAFQYGGLRMEGYGTNNALVGGASVISRFLNYATGIHDFRNGFIGGPGPNEDNISLLQYGGTLMLGPNNTYKGQTRIYKDVLEVSKLANRGEISSIGTGDFNASAHIIDMAFHTTADNANFAVVATLRYVGDTDSVTNRPINFTNSDVATDISSTTAVLENVGTGTVQFTSPFTAAGTNTVQRLFRLTGTNMGDNEIVSITDAGAAAKTRIEKTGIGKWIITGNSTHTAGTVISNGILQLGNGGTAGSVNGGVIMLEEQGILRVSRSDNHVLSSIISGTGILEIANTPTGVTRMTNPISDFFGPLKVLSGALLVDSTEPGYEFLSPTGFGSITVSEGATLGGSGYILPDVGQSITLTGGYLDVGTSRDVAGFLTIGAGDGADLALQAGSTILLDLIGGAGLGDQTDNLTAADLLTVYGSLVLGEDSILHVRTDLLPNAFAEGDAWKLFDWEGLAERQGSFASTVLPDLSPELKWDLSALYTQGVIQVVAIPEPGRMLLVGIALAGISLRRRRN